MSLIVRPVSNEVIRTSCIASCPCLSACSRPDGTSRERGHGSSLHVTSMALVAVQNEQYRARSSPLLVCHGAFPQRVALGEAAVFHIGGCAFSRQTFTVTIVMLLDAYGSAFNCVVAS